MTPLLLGDCEGSDRSRPRKLGISLERPNNWVEFSLDVVMPSRLDPNVPPHKTIPFWFIVALSVLVAVGYPLTVRSNGPLWSDIVPSVVTFLIMVCVGWFAVRRVQRGQTGSRKWSFVLVIIAIILFILAQIFKRHPW